MAWQHGETGYNVIDEFDPAADQVPAEILHGGPGCASDYVEPIADLLHESGSTTILYDQIGCGRSSHLRDAPAEFWTVQLFKDELDALLEHLGIVDR